MELQVPYPTVSLIKMEWLSEFLKNVLASRMANGAAFFTSGVLLAAYKWMPNFFQPILEKCFVPLLIIFLFTGSIIGSRVLSFLWTKSKMIFFRTRTKVKAKNLSQSEETILMALAIHADEGINLRNGNYPDGSHMKLEVLEISKILSEKGLVRINPYDENLLTLSTTGRKKALELARNSGQTGE